MVRCAIRQPVEQVQDGLALQSGFAAHRMSATALLLDGPGEFIVARGRRKMDYSSCSLEIWADSLVTL